jgi:hypothetical protein
MAGVENPISANQVELHDGGAAAQLPGDVEAALAALKQGSAVLDRDIGTSVQTVDEVMELMRAEIAELRAELDEGRTAIMPPPSLLYERCKMPTCKESLVLYTRVYG